MKKIILIGPFPPPVHGMSKNLNIVADVLGNNSNVIRICTSPETIVRSKRYHLTKIRKVMSGLFKMVINCLMSRNITMYMPPDAGLGMYYSILFVVIARIMGLKIYFHHRSFSYINEFKRTMFILVKVAGKAATHIFLCQEMESKFRSKYRLRFKSLIVSNAQHVKIIEKDKIKPVSSTFVIGHLSNLSIEKGLNDVLEIMEKLIRENYDVKLIIAGPEENSNAEHVLKNAVTKMEPHIEYRGYLDNSQKELFFSDIDLFLFPSRYRNEAQPNVLFEANSFAVPVVSFERGCIRSDVNSDNGVVLDPNGNFSVQAFPIIVNWLLNPEKFMNLKETTLAMIGKENEIANEQFMRMIRKLEE